MATQEPAPNQVPALSELRPDAASGPVSRDRSYRATIDRFDEGVDDLLDGIRGNPVADRVAYSLSELGNFSLIWYVLAAAKASRSDEPIQSLARFAAIIGVEFAVVNGGIKSLFNRERPADGDDHPHGLRRPSTSSFPSGHATSAFTAAAVLSTDSPLAPVYYGLAVAVAASRVYVRLHHASDVLGGVAIGIGLGAIAHRAWPPGRRHPLERP